MLHNTAIQRFRRLISFLCLFGWGAVSAGEPLNWQALIDETRGKSRTETVALVNQRINRIKKLSDIKNWQQNDFWATPFELAARGAGDCEDLTIAKYYLLRSHGVPETHLRLMIARMLNGASGRIESHLVTLYFATEDSEPVVLDNTRRNVLPLSYRHDLLPKAAFDRNSYWIYKNGNWLIASDMPPLKSWQRVQRRWARQLTDSLVAQAPRQR